MSPVYRVDLFQAPLLIVQLFSLSVRDKNQDLAARDL